MHNLLLFTLPANILFQLIELFQLLIFKLQIYFNNNNKFYIYIYILLKIILIKIVHLLLLLFFIKTLN